MRIIPKPLTWLVSASAGLTACETTPNAPDTNELQTAEKSSAEPPTPSSLGSDQTSPKSVARIANGGSVAEADEKENPIAFRLNQGQGSAPETTQKASTTDLSEEATQQLLGRAPDIKTEAADQKTSALREGPKAPELPGINVESLNTPSATKPDQVEASEPKVLRMSPEGEVPLAARLSITFATPMISVATIEALQEGNVPAKISPAVEGTWRWLGTRTLIFEAKGGRMPMATQYTLEVPKGVKDAQGRELKEGQKVQFSTPAPTLLNHSPSHSQVSTNPLILLTFDQKVTPANVAKALELKKDKSSIELRLVNVDEFQKELGDIRKNEDLKGRWVALTPVKPLAKSTDYTFNLKPFRGDEGPRESTLSTWTIRTHGPLTIVEIGPLEWGSHNQIKVKASNSLQCDAFKPSLLKLSPEVKNLSAECMGDSLYVTGDMQPETSYTLTVAKALTDSFGQTLDADFSGTFTTKAAEPALHTNFSTTQILDPAAGKRQLRVYSSYLKEFEVVVRRVTPEDYYAYLSSSSKQDGSLEQPPGEVVFNDTVKTEDAKAGRQETLIDLNPAISGEFGHALVSFRVKDFQSPDWRGRWQNVWVQSTKLGVDVFSDAQGAHVWVNDLVTGAPVEGAVIKQQSLPEVRTNALGLSWLELSKATWPEKKDNYNLLTVTRGEDTVLLSNVTSTGSVSESVLWWVVDAQKLYRPGETVRVKGALRELKAGGKATPSLFAKSPEVKWVAQDAYGTELAKGTVKTSALNSFNFEFKLPQTPNLGHAHIVFELVGAKDSKGNRSSGSHYHQFRIEEFRKPDFELSLSMPTSSVLIGQKASIGAKASYFAGGALANSPIRWNVNASRTTYSPPNHDEFIFGERKPWWGPIFPRFPGNAQDSSNSQVTDGRTDSQGEHTLDLSLDSKHPWPVQFAIEATVSDTNNQTWSSNSNLIVHPSELYVGLKPERWFADTDGALKVDAVVVDIAGLRKEGIKVRIEAKRLVNEKALANSADAPKAEVCEIVSGKEPVSCTFKPGVAGNYSIKATIQDAAERQNQTSLNLWVPGEQGNENTSVEQKELQLIPNKNSYAPSETAEVLVMAPFKEGEIVATSARRGEISEIQRVQIKDGTATLRIPIEEWMVPDLSLHVFANGPEARVNAEGQPDSSLPPQPAYATGQIELPISKATRELSIQATPDKRELAPGEKTTIRVKVNDDLGKGVQGAEVAVFVIDEALLALVEGGYSNPLDVFYPKGGNWLMSQHNREQLLLAKLAELYGQLETPEAPVTESMMLDGMGSGGGGRFMAMAANAAPMMAKSRIMAAADTAAAPKVQVRADFSSLAAFFPQGSTNARGEIEVPVKLPDSLTRYRVIAFALNGATDFGMKEDQMVARLPLSLRVKAPRFLNFGDRFELSVQVQNLTDNTQTVDLAVRAANLSLQDSKGRQVVVPARERLEVRIPISAEMAGTARVQVVAASENFSDAQEVTLPVWTPATTEAFATYGQVDGDGAVYTIDTPKDVLSDFGGLEIETSSTQLQALTDALLYITNYRFPHADSLASRIFAIASLKDVLSSFKAEGLPSSEDLFKTVQEDIQQLTKFQKSSGGFSFWDHSEEVSPFLSVHVTHALIRAQEHGFSVPENTVRRAFSYLSNIRSHLDNTEWMTPETRDITEAYALYVRQLRGETDGKRAKELIHARGGFSKASMEMVGWLYPVFKAANDTASLTELRKLLTNRVSETADAAHFVTSYSDGAWVLLHSDKRVDAILLEGLIADQPQSDLIPKLVRGLLKDRVKGRWNTLQDNTWALIALERYFKVYEEKVPNFVSRTWLGDRFAGEHTFQGRTRERAQTVVPTKELLEQGESQKLTLSKAGSGRMYYRVGLRYAPSSLDLKAQSAGFTIERRYESIDDPSDVTRNEEGQWVIKAGARVKVSLLMHTPDRRYHVVLADWMPAGFEAINGGLKGSQREKTTANADKLPWWFWRSTWYEHEQLRDERAEAYTSQLWEGVHSYEYTARATTPGTYVVPPAKAEEIYSPEVFGRSSSEVVIIR